MRQGMHYGADEKRGPAGSTGMGNPAAMRTACQPAPPPKPRSPGPKHYKESLNLPKTAFPMRANSVEREPERLAFWEERNLYQRIQKKHAASEPFVLHDGPPYANGNIHMGHALNKILKDIVLRYKTMRGYRTPYVPGWDCHGLPIEQQVLKKIGPRIHEMEAIEVRRLCHDYAAQFIDLQRKQFKRLGILGDWDKPYQTFDPSYEAGILECLRDLVAKGFVRKGFKVVYWDPVFRTALAEAEIEYHPHTSDSIYVRFPLLHPEKYAVLDGFSNLALVVWTTTPWTLPANLGVCLHPDFDYVAIEHGGQTSIVAKTLAESFMKECRLQKGKVSPPFKVADLDRAECRHPIFKDRSSLVMLAPHVTLEQGTGCVHTAPGHGAEDFEVGLRYGLPVAVPVDESGCFTSEYPEMEGRFVFAANPEIVAFLKEKGLLLGAGKVTHDYPFSWRSKKPIIFRATEQWFMEFDHGDIREKALRAIDHSVRWIPQWGCERIRRMVQHRPDWCLSRQRSWGVPIPSIRSRKTGESILSVALIDSFIERVREKGTDCWFAEPLATVFPKDFSYPPTGENKPEDFEKEYDILDVWFDSGSSHIAALEKDERLVAPADLYLEGSDQHRGWFQSALLTSLGTRERAPFKAVLTHGFLLDGEGKAMSKSAGNSISPLQLISEMGGDILRLWVASVDYRNDVRVSEEIISHVIEAYRTIRNTLRFQLGNLSDFDFQADSVPLESLLPLDRWALHAMAELIEEVVRAYENYEFQRVYQLINRFATVTLSATYHDILKDRLYTFGKKSKGRRSAQTVIFHQFHSLLKLLAPILVFTTDEAFAFFRENKSYQDDSIHLQSLPETPADWRRPRLKDQFEKLFRLRDKVNDELEKLRGKKEIGQSLEAEITLAGHDSNETFQLLRQFEPSLAELFIVSQVTLQTSLEKTDFISITARKASGQRCPRCWRRVPELEMKEEIEGLCSRCREVMKNDRRQVCPD